MKRPLPYNLTGEPVGAVSQSLMARTPNPLWRGRRPCDSLCRRFVSSA